MGDKGEVGEDVAELFKDKEKLDVPVDKVLRDDGVVIVIHGWGCGDGLEVEHEVICLKGKTLSSKEICLAI